MIDTMLILGFSGAGKTTYIRDLILGDYYYEEGNTLILCFENGGAEYYTEALKKKRAYVEYYTKGDDFVKFCKEQIRKYSPVRICVEMNNSYLLAGQKFPRVMDVTEIVTLIEWDTLPVLLDPFRQVFNLMVGQSDQVIFRGCPSRDLLEPYSKEFRAMNYAASFLRKDPEGNYDRAFDLILPYSLDSDKLTIKAEDYLIFWLDAYDHPERYKGKDICFPDPMEIHYDEEGWSTGRLVMNCCMADLQYVSLDLTGNVTDFLKEGWFTLDAKGCIGYDIYGQAGLVLELKSFDASGEPKSGRVLQPNMGAN